MALNPLGKFVVGAAVLDGSWVVAGRVVARTDVVVDAALVVAAVVVDAALVVAAFEVVPDGAAVVELVALVVLAGVGVATAELLVE
jgi:hypothetical protein